MALRKDVNSELHLADCSVAQMASLKEWTMAARKVSQLVAKLAQMRAASMAYYLAAKMERTKAGRKDNNLGLKLAAQWAHRSV